MNGTPQQEILRQLQDGWDALADAVRGLGDLQAGRRPAPESWSVLDCVEHIAATEAVLLVRLREATPQGETHEDPAREAKLRGLALNRERRIEAPEPVCPQGTCRTLAEALARFATARAETLRFVEEFEGDLRSSLTIHPLISRPLNCYEMLMLMALHPRRHAQQIAEIRRALP